MFPRHCCGLFVLLAVSLPAPAEVAPLPDPMTLADALVLARDDHPALEESRVAGMAARDELGRIEDTMRWQAWLDLDARTADKVRTQETRFDDDSRASLYLARLLTDFGASSADREAAGYRIAGADAVQDYRASRHRIEILRRFFDVHLADLRYFVDDEDMTLAYLRYDRVRDRREKFGEFSEIDELALESEYRRLLVERERAANQRRRARSALALAMGRPGELVNNVAAPALDDFERPAPDYDAILAETLEAHPLLAAYDLKIQAASRTVERHRQSHRPLLSARLEATEWSQETGNRDEYLASLQLLVPLGATPVRDALAAEAATARYRLQAERRALEFALRDEVLDLVLGLEELALEVAAARVEEDYRDRYLDRSRTLYQLETRTDLGDSQARQAEAHWRTREVAYRRAIHWANLDALRGLPITVPLMESSQ